MEIDLKAHLDSLIFYIFKIAVMIILEEVFQVGATNIFLQSIHRRLEKLQL